MKLQIHHKLMVAGALFTLMMVMRVSAQTSQTPAPAPAAAQAVESAKPAANAGLADILKMIDSGVSPEVVKAYVENAPTPFDLTAADLITLKEHKVTDEITVALLKHSSAAANQAAPAPVTPAHTYVINTANTSVSDPDYQFFQHYYLMPRTQAYVNETLGYPAVPYGEGFAPAYPMSYGYGYAYAPSYGFAVGPGFSSGPRRFSRSPQGLGLR